MKVVWYWQSKKQNRKSRNRFIYTYNLHMMKLEFQIRGRGIFQERVLKIKVKHFSGSPVVKTPSNAGGVTGSTPGGLGHAIVWVQKNFFNE